MVDGGVMGQTVFERSNRGEKVMAGNNRREQVRVVKERSVNHW